MGFIPRGLPGFDAICHTFRLDGVWSKDSCEGTVPVLPDLAQKETTDFAHSAVTVCQRTRADTSRQWQIRTLERRSHCPVYQ